MSKDSAGANRGERGTMRGRGSEREHNAFSDGCGTHSQSEREPIDTGNSKERQPAESISVAEHRSLTILETR